MSDNLPGAAGDLARRHPEVWAAYAKLGEACSTAGPLSAHERRLVKLALAIGAASVGAVHSHARRAEDEGIEDVALPALVPGTVVILDNPSTHKSPQAAEILKAHDCWTLLPPTRQISIRSRWPSQS